MDQDRILRVLGPGVSQVQTVRNTLAAVVVTGPERDQRRMFFVRRESGGIVAVVHGPAVLDASSEAVVFPEGGLQFRPVDEVRAHGMNPALFHRRANR